MARTEGTWRLGEKNMKISIKIQNLLNISEIIWVIHSLGKEYTVKIRTHSEEHGSFNIRTYAIVT